MIILTCPLDYFNQVWTKVSVESVFMMQCDSTLPLKSDATLSNTCMDKHWIHFLGTTPFPRLEDHQRCARFSSL